MAQLFGYTLAASANLVPPRLRPVRVGAQALRYLVRSNLASAEGFWKFVGSSGELTLWDRVEKGAGAG